MRKIGTNLLISPRPFRFGAIVHPDYMELALRLPPLEDRLNARIELRAYTEQIDRIYFAPILMPEPADPAVAIPEERRFDPEQRSVWLQVRFDVAEAAELAAAAFEARVTERLERELRALPDGNLSIDLQRYLAADKEE